ncbi:hypothetical protein ACIBSV_30820 [Embleya sp. NPDC050154]|uniref:hypothetical protein n=1 Tax=Embleya sp. NPDC050154 TaxID=3363988 RepID=UPI0037A8E8E1
MPSARKRLTAAAVAPLLLFAVGCSDDSGNSGNNADGKSGSPTTSATTGSSTSAPGSPQASGSGTPAPSGSGTSRPSDGKGSPAKTLNAAQLGAAFVVAADLPSPGWRVTTPEVEEPDVSTVDKPACQPIMDLMGGGGATHTSVAHISGELTPPGAAKSQYAFSLASYQPGAAEKLLKDAKAALPSCGTFRYGTPSLTYHVTPLPTPNAGDESIAFKVSSDFGLSARMTTTRAGYVIVQGASQNADQELPPGVHKAQTDKVTAAQRG